MEVTLLDWLAFVASLVFLFVLPGYSLSRAVRLGDGIAGWALASAAIVLVESLALAAFGALTALTLGFAVGVTIAGLNAAFRPASP